MRWFKRRKVRIALILFGTVVLAGYFLWEPLFFTFLYSGTRADRELAQLRDEFTRQKFQLADLRRSSGSDQELEATQKSFGRWQDEARERCLEIATENPGTQAEASALLMVSGHWPESVEGKSAYEKLLRAASNADIAEWAKALDQVHFSNRDIDRWRPLIAHLIQRVEIQPDHPDASWLLCEAGNLVAPDSDAESVPEEFVTIGDLIRDRYAASPGLANFCEQVGGVGGMGSAPGWGRRFEPHIRRILEVNEDRFVRCSAKFALACIVRSGAIERQPEAHQLFEEFLAEFDGETDYHAQSIEQHYRQTAQRVLESIRAHGLGAPAPATVGVDFEGRPMSLSDYRGQVVLLSFWATWCYPCMKAIPHEKELVERFGSAQFAVVGVNADKKLALAREVVARHDISWRSFRVKRDDESSIADDWHIAGYPTFYLIDAEGVVMGNWLGMPPQTELEAKIGALIAKHEGRAHSPLAFDASHAKSTERGTAEQSAPIEVVADTPGATGFVGKVLLRKTGGESKYVVFLPEGYDESEEYPTILFLHGAGAQGTDGHKQLMALGPAINRRKSSFPFIAVFPQASSGDWQPKTGHGDLAMAVLDDVMRTYSVEPDRVALSGVSMGGEGTWGLAAAYPEKWSAIIPLCGSGDPESVGRFAHVPCWCFQGGKDTSTSPELSRSMVRALRRAGGQPIYIEYPNVGHNCWDLAYGRDDLFEWLIEQKRKR